MAVPAEDLERGRSVERSTQASVPGFLHARERDLSTNAPKTGASRP